MLLHQNIKEFRKIVILTATHYGLQEYQIEKDYYISLFLKPLGNMSKNIPIVFKGGTSLSKCYGVISRFSEDIDLSVIQNKQLTRKQKKDLKQLIIETAKEIGAEVININEIESRKHFNRYILKFNSVFNSDVDTLQKLIIETMIAYNPFPAIYQKTENIILEYLKIQKKNDIIGQYQLDSFLFLTQSIERTFVDKIFALCDYHLLNKYERNSRHLYDLHMIWESGLLDKKILPSLIDNVIAERQKYPEYNPSVSDGQKPRQLLMNIIDSDVYKTDFNKVTTKLLFQKTTYETCKNTLYQIILSELVPEIINK